MQAGYTLDEIRAITRDAIDFALSHSLVDKQTVGNNFIGYNAYIERYAQIEDFITVLKVNGFDVWIVSASNQYIVEPFAEHFGIAADHVIVVRAALDSNNKLTYRFQGIGTFPDNNGEIITDPINSYIPKLCLDNVL